MSTPNSLPSYSLAIQAAIALHGYKWPAYLSIVQLANGRYQLRHVTLL